MLRRDASTATTRAPEPVVREIAVVEPLPIEVAYLAGPSPATVTGSAPGGGRISRTHAPAGDETAPPATPHDVAPPRGPSVYMNMRGPALHLSDREADGILDHPEAPPPAPHVSGKLENAPGGRAVIRDAVTSVTVERDGT